MECFRCLEYFSFFFFFFFMKNSFLVKKFCTYARRGIWFGNIEFSFEKELFIWRGEGESLRERIHFLMVLGVWCICKKKKVFCVVWTSFMDIDEKNSMIRYKFFESLHYSFVQYEFRILLFAVYKYQYIILVFD